MGCRALCLILLCGFIGSYAQPQCTLITPNVLRLESQETIIVDGHDSEFEAEISIHDFPKKKYNIVTKKVHVNEGNGFMGSVNLMIPSTNLIAEPGKKQFVYVTVKSPRCNLEKVVLVTYQSGYIFLQTDKPLYTPGSTVLYRIFTMNPSLQPMNKPVIVEFLTPENVIVKKNLLQQSSTTGIISQSHTLTDLVSLGVWTISAKYEDADVQNYSTNFEVKEYVLPSFEIKLKPAKTFFYLKDQEFRVDIHANYLYGKPVTGKAFTLFGVKRENEKKSLPDTLRLTEISYGTGSATLERKDLVKYFQEEVDMLEWRLYLTVTVITDTGSDLLEAELDDIYIVSSPYKILFTKTSKYFQPGMPFDFMVFVTNPDGSPAESVPVMTESGAVKGSTQNDGTVRLIVNTASDISSRKITVTTTDPKLTDDQQASATMTATAYSSSSGNYLHISSPGGVLKPRQTAVINFSIRNRDRDVQDQIRHFRYVIMNKGRIMKVGRQERSPGQNLVSMVLLITEEFIPSFRIVAYYTVPSSAGHEIVADSTWVDVSDTCMGTLELSADKDKDKGKQNPGTKMNLKLRADHKAIVGLVAVDKGIYVLNSKYKISQSKVWDSVETYDIGCTPGSGADAPGVFYDAGLALHTSFQMTTPQRSDPFCQVKSKRRRRESAALIQQKHTKATERQRHTGYAASQYTGMEMTCCQDGMSKNTVGYSCEHRSRLIQDGEKCIAAFLDCCKEIEKLRSLDTKLHEHDDQSRSDYDTDYIDDDEIISRTDFPESFNWKTEIMNEEPDANGISTKTLDIYLRDSITTWEVLAVSLSANKGICVSTPHDIQVSMDFFIDLKLPYSVVRNEQVEIRAILYNYGNSQHKVRVEWTYNEHICSLSTAKKKYRQDVLIQPESSVAVPFIIVPLTLGLHDVEVKAAAQYVSDGVKKKLKVVPEGRRITETLKSVTLEPEVKGKDGVQEERISALNARNIVPKTDVQTIATVQGTLITEMVEKSIDGINLNDLIRIPGGCGEQNMMSMTPTVIATHYLDATNQWDRIGVDRREKALQYIQKGYDNQMPFRQADSSYRTYGTSKASTWLTAYVVKVFALASNFIHIEKDVLCGSVKWLIQNKQLPDGVFQEDSPVYTQGFSGGITRGAKELESTLTAFVLVAMLESEAFCTGEVANLRHSIDLSTTFISEEYQSLEKPYSIAITSYALARAGKLKDAKKLISASTDKTHWEESGSHHLSLEATSYALLALLKLKQYEEAAPLVRWLTEKKFYGGVYGSTQPTIMMFQALAQYQIEVPLLKDLEMDVSYKLPGRSQSKTVRINLQNAMLARSEQTTVNGDFVVTATGKGRGSLTVLSMYYAIETEKEKMCNNFDLSVTITDAPLAKRPEGAKSTVNMTICARSHRNQEATMSIFDISMMTGYTPDMNQIKNLKKGVDRIITNYEINNGEFDKGTLILYTDKISRTEEECMQFNLHQYFEVGLIQPASVTVYDYYSPENRCTKFYHVEDSSKLLGTICQGQVCRCAQENCFMQQQLDEVDAIERLTRACDVAVDYVYKTKLNAIEHRGNFDVYNMTIAQLIKEGTDINPQNQIRSFISHAKCQKALQLQEGQEYLIWGVSKDLWDTGAGYSYMITKDTWVEMWPSSMFCQKRENSEFCEEIFNFSEELFLRGCIS
ncbi:A.superbus venom factor 1-like isoform X3 [Pseudophryne corroboree]|uniref:A.superbus venom factor 1-like isoform X3 n=1 Tax=Pseudophryne corroboree TaxID=495146 RepID=UPI003081B64C